jgi:hypothetical protein
MMRDELEMIWNEAIPQNLPVGTEKNNEYPEAMLWPQLELRISQIQLLSSGKKVALIFLHTVCACLLFHFSNKILSHVRVK